jgi:hypothetical protein
MEEFCKGIESIKKAGKTGLLKQFVAVGEAKDSALWASQRIHDVVCTTPSFSQLVALMSSQYRKYFIPTKKVLEARLKDSTNPDAQAKASLILDFMNNKDVQRAIQIISDRLEDVRNTINVCVVGLCDILKSNYTSGSFGNSCKVLQNMNHYP